MWANHPQNCHMIHSTAWPILLPGIVLGWLWRLYFSRPTSWEHKFCSWSCRPWNCRQETKLLPMASLALKLRYTMFQGPYFSLQDLKHLWWKTPVLLVRHLSLGSLRLQWPEQCDCFGLLGEPWLRLQLLWHRQSPSGLLCLSQSPAS